jgi:hypothetical protein
MKNGIVRAIPKYNGKIVETWNAAFSLFGLDRLLFK